MKFHVGCSGWSYSAWKGPFYPPNLEDSDWLRFYSQVFDYVEIDSSFYRMPNQFTVKNWDKKTPDNFRFTAKFPKIITHDKHLVDVDEEVQTFLNNMEPLQEKILALLIQLPPSIEIMPGLEGLRQIIPLLDRRFRYAVEVRHQSWFQDLAYNTRRIKQAEKEKEKEKEIDGNKKLNLAIVAANNHYAGFGPGTVKIFRKMVGLSEVP